MHDRRAPRDVARRERGRFETSDPTLDAVWNLARHSALYDTQEQFLDTPTREKGPFLADSFDVSQATMAAFGERALTRRRLRDFARSQTRYWPDGRVNAVYPNGDGKRDIPDFTEAYVEWVWQYWMTTRRSRSSSPRCIRSSRNITDYVANAIDPKTGLVTNLPGGGGDYLVRRRRLAAADALRLRHEHRRTHDDQRARGRRLPTRRAMAQTLGRPASEARDERARRGSPPRSAPGSTRPDGVFVDGLHADGTQSRTRRSRRTRSRSPSASCPPRHTSRQSPTGRRR